MPFLFLYVRPRIYVESVPRRSIFLHWLPDMKPQLQIDSNKNNVEMVSRGRKILQFFFKQVIYASNMAL